MSHMPEPTERWDGTVFFDAIRAVQITRVDEYVHDKVVQRQHFVRNGLERFALHPLVHQLIKANHRPLDWQQLLFEWPHVSEVDKTQIAYARNMEAYERDLFTRTSVGKYVRRHWPHLPDHVIRDIATPYSQKDEFRILDDIRDIVAAIHFGPNSCMKWSIDDDEEFIDRVNDWWLHGEDIDGNWWEVHPYAVYDPAFGWRLAIRYNPSDPKRLLGRAIVNEKTLEFVRTYARRSDDSEQSCDDDALRMWLREQGYKHTPYWPEGMKFKRLDYPSGDYDFMMPYLDGSSSCYRRVRMGHDGIIRDDNGEYECSNTDGGYDYEEPYGSCDDCDETIREADYAYQAYRDGHEVTLCECCVDSYSWASRWNGYRSSEERVHDDNIVTVHTSPRACESWDVEALHESIVKLDNDDYAFEDATVTLADGRVVLHNDDDYVEVNGDWYEVNDDVLVCIHGEYFHTEEDLDDRICCVDGVWYTTDDPRVEENADGNWVLCSVEESNV